MNDNELEPMPRDVEDLLDREKSLVVVPPVGMEQAVLASVTATVLAGPPAAGAPAGTSAPGGAVAAGGIKAALAGKLATGVLLFALGTIAGAGGHALYVRDAAPVPALQPAPAPVLPVPAEPPASSAALPAPVPEPVAAIPAPAVPAAPPRVKLPPSPAPPAARTNDTALAAERGVLEMARMALARGQADGAIPELEKHARLYPSGQLAEEREALWVQALVSASRFAEARSKGAQFQKRYPHSMLLPSVQATLESIP